jgi:hypothetical protein
MNRPMLKDTTTDMLSLAQAMDLLKDGMEKVAFDIVRFQAMVGDLVRAAGSSNDETVVERAQAIDAMAQTLFRLTRSAEAIGEAAQGAGAGDVGLDLDRTSKSDLRAAAGGAVDGAGDMDLF